MNELMLALKEILKHRRIKTNSEKKLFSVMIDDMFNELVKHHPELTYTKDETDPPTNSTLEEELADTKNAISQWLKLMISDDVISKLDIDELSNFSIQTSYEIIIGILDGFTWDGYQNHQMDLHKGSLFITVENSKIPNKKNVFILPYNNKEPAFELNNFNNNLIKFIETLKTQFKQYTKQNESII